MVLMTWGIWKCVRFSCVIKLLDFPVPAFSCVIEVFDRVKGVSTWRSVAVFLSSVTTEIYGRADGSSDDFNTLGIAVLLASSCAIEIFDFVDEDST